MDRRIKHGCHDTPEYEAWESIKQRCLNPKCHCYHHYGGRGITICERWYDFVNFLADMGLRTSLMHEIERIDNDLGYSPENCRWATRKEQCNNNRRNHFVTAFGETKTLTQWFFDERCVVPHGTLQWRLNHNWSPERALTLPVQQNHRLTVGWKKPPANYRLTPCS